MNYRMLGYVLGRIFMVEAALLLPPSIVAVIYGEWSCLFAFVVTAVGLAVLGLVLGLRSPANKRYPALPPPAPASCAMWKP